MPSPALSALPSTPIRQPVRRAARRVPDHHCIGTHSLQRPSGVLETLTLGHTRTLGREVDDIGAPELGRGFEADPGTRRILIKKIEPPCRPRHVGSFLISRPDTAAISPAISRISVAVSASRSAAESRCFMPSPGSFRQMHLRRRHDSLTQALAHAAASDWTSSPHPVDLGQLDPDLLAQRRRDVLAHIVRRGSQRKPAEPASWTTPGQPQITDRMRAQGPGVVRPEKSTSSTRNHALGTGRLLSAPEGGTARCSADRSR